MSISPAIAEHLRALGNGFSLPAVQALYAPLLAGQPTAGVLRQTDLAYGTHPRHQLDVCWCFARQGFVTVLPKTAWRPTAAGPAGPRTWRRCWPGCSATPQAMAAMPGAWC